MTIFKTVSSKETATITLERLFKYIQEGRWRHLVERIRQATERGDKKEADRLKKKLAYVCFSGRFRNGSHAAECLEDYISFICLDYDDVDPADLEKLKQKAMMAESTLMAYITPSGRGLKIVVLTNATREQHAQAYAQVAEYYDQLLGIRCDSACKDISRGHFVSYDFYARFNQEAIPFEVEASAEKDQIREDDAPATAPPMENIPDCAGHPGINGQEFVLVALSLYPAAEGNRNTRLFHIACAARDRGLEAQEIVRGAVRYMADDTFDAHEIASIVKSAYSRKKSVLSRNQEKNADTKCTSQVQVLLSTKNSANEPDEEDEEPDGEELREHTPLFPASVYAQLPEFLSAVLKYTNDPREIDMLLLSVLTVVSALIPTTYGYYRNKRVWANFYTFVVAPAACGKGVMEYALTLCRVYLKSFADENQRLAKKYKKDCEAYEKYVRSRNKGDTVMERPEPPVYCHLQIPSTVSKSRFLLHLRDNGELGGFIFDLEADTMTVSNKQEFGNYFDYLRKIFHHEPVEDSYKTNVVPTYVFCPKASALIAGTPAQFYRFIPTPEDGMYSRVLTYTYTQQEVWKDVSPTDDEEEVERYFDQLAMRLNQMLLFLRSSTTRMKLTDEQWACLNLTYGSLLERELFSSRQHFQSSIKRYCLITYRICMILSSIEKATLRMDVKEITCSDRNFETALSIVTCCLEHNRLLITSYRDTDKDVPVLKDPNVMDRIFERMPNTFTAAQYLEVASTYEISRRKAFAVLKKSIGVFVKKLCKGVYQKLRKVH